MRIKSKFHDYYDAAQAHGQDQGLVFVRNFAEFEFDSKAHLSGAYAWLETELAPLLPRSRVVRIAGSGIWEVSLRPILILFAGRLFPCMDVGTWRHGVGVPTTHQFVYNELDYNDLAASLGCKVGTPAPRHSWMRDDSVSVPDFFALKGSEALMGAAIGNKVAIASVCNGGSLTGGRGPGTKTLHVNPTLKDAEFFRCLDAWQAFQELSMFVGNLAAPDRSMVEVSNKSKVAKHGFDDLSFRKGPELAMTRAARARLKAGEMALTNAAL